MKKGIYKNAPLTETVFEITFPGDPAVECKRDKFYNKIKDIYPTVYVPNAYEGKAPALSPYKFERTDKTYAVMTALNKVALSCAKYEGFSVFKKEAMRIFSIFGQLFKIKKLNRTGLRYINIIPITREKKVIPLQNYLNVKIDLPEQITTDFENLKMFFVTRTKGGDITTRIDTVVSKEKQEEAIMLDFDYAKDEHLTYDSIEQYIDESHEHTKYLFEKFITKEYKKVMKGEVI